ncbi:2-deoxy-D-gluconate 3-dehydrogenase [Reticulibacter mediterranei]|uniref:2-deoxy-D-gluconate 3-dehydrogenase n=1 Tax=Reticulibacter mediterranei TaxID=2778369 RepID=A0A8J3MWR0_9CHLR|nr:SDR family oxidoreductase [Reticulibacter mediterranei]GHO90114.1 2-deoxy-D-gluconate 3-dehydrogenase [Reticulibacter mediterranei]
MDIQNKVAIVTGAAVGIGRAISERLASAGVAVVLTDINAREGAETLRRIQQAAGRAEFREADITSDSQVQQIIDFAVDAFGRLDILINNAGGGGHIPPHFPEASPPQWSKILDLNLRAPLLATQLALVPMSRQGSGAVINIGSTAGLGLSDYQSPEYAAAKAGLIRATSCLARLHKTSNIRINCIVPDWVETERALQELAAMSETERTHMPPRVPLSQLCQEIVALIENERASGRVVVLWGGQPARILD